MRRFGCLLGCLIVCVFTPTTQAQTTREARPTVGLRTNPVQITLLQNATVVRRPGSVATETSILVDGQSIIAVGKDLTPPAGALVIDCSGKMIYPAFIDAYSEIDVDEIPDDGVKHWNGYILPRRSAVAAASSVSQSDAFRKQGIAVRMVAPRGGIIKGSSCVVTLDRDNGGSLLKEDVAQHAQLTIPRDRRRDGYPNSPMGAVALLRQTLHDANWYVSAQKAWEANPKLSPPVRNDDLACLAKSLTEGVFILDAQNERMAIRAGSIAREFSLQAILHGSGREYRDADAIAKYGLPLLIPVDFPKPPDVTSEAAADDVELRELMHWHFAPENPKRLADAGVTICLTTDGLDNAKSYLENVRKAVERGLAPDDALAAMTTTPASLLAIDHVVGQIQPGFAANLLIFDGDLFAKQSKLLETWVNGNRYEHAPETKAEALAGKWEATLSVADQDVPLIMELVQDKKKWTGKFIQVDLPESQPESDESDSDESENEETDAKDESADKTPEPKRVDLKGLTHATDRITAWADLSKADERLPKGPTRLTIVTAQKPGDEAPSLFASLRLPDGTQLHPTWERSEPEDDQADEKEKSEKEADKAPTFHSLKEIAINYPLGGYGVESAVASPKSVLFRGATVWTCGPEGVLESADVLVVDGKIQTIGQELNAPQDCQVVDASGKHISPGLIDCHSHMGTDGGINEAGQAITAEVRISDFIDNTDISIYRQLAGGLTSSNILHGSANPIGGQNQVIKLRWGDSMEAMKFESAPAGIKFALGENVKRSNGGDRSTRYPGSRMGVPEIMKDRFLAAKEYMDAQQRYREGKRDALPPRFDLELEAIAEILRGERWIHCHSYRQDEIITLLDLLDEFEITIGSLQHILEGYKVADRMLEHGAMASSFSDWWAYKFEVYDAIPDNGAIMHDIGLVVSFNSDDQELARHLNTEAAKAMKYGGVSAEEALKFVTLNPAKQLRIDNRVGSIETGKDADLVVWSGPPLSTLSRCEQTWVDGREMFSLQKDQQLRERDQSWKTSLINYILAGDTETDAGEEHEVEEEDRWLRFDEFCHGHDHDHDHAEHQHESDHAEAF
ncbi:amidohydrolase family protein [Rhodopirellula sp. MGV]|uniref:amidohydrolase family protein n=1 Tax=Rhodopirellula sp. MGV TaxID=2023130 RepID=UPI00117A09C7|nr:amidohydrolase family protein [Rhodopirellula sp. MGV]